MRFAVAAAVFAALAMLAAIFWRMWEAKKQPQITSTLVIYSSEPTPGVWNALESTDPLIQYFSDFNASSSYDTEYYSESNE